MRLARPNRILALYAFINIVTMCLVVAGSDGFQSRLFLQHISSCRSCSYDLCPWHKGSGPLTKKDHLFWSCQLSEVHLYLFWWGALLMSQRWQWDLLFHWSVLLLYSILVLMGIKSGIKAKWKISCYTGLILAAGYRCRIQMEDGPWSEQAWHKRLCQEPSWRESLYRSWRIQGTAGWICWMVQKWPGVVKDVNVGTFPPPGYKEFRIEH